MQNFIPVWEKIPIQSQQFRMLMRISTFSFAILLYSTHLLTASPTMGQNLLEKKITLGVKNSSLRNTLNRIRQISGFRMAYALEQVAPYRHINLSKDSRSVEQTLKEVLEGTGLTFKEGAENTILIIRPPSQEPETNISPSSQLPNQAGEVLTAREIRGKVTDEDGEGLPGVSILIRGTQRGTITNASGDFVLSTTDEDIILIVSYVGYVSQEIRPENLSEVYISMLPDQKSLNEVVVVGYGTVKKSDLTGSVSSVKPEDLERVPVTNINQALQGRAAGVQIRQTQQQPGGGLSVRIRGISSIQGNTDPLYVIDGIIGGDINTLNPQDIESLEVLKDASATAIFGANGANGVVLITTKRGSTDKSVINFNSYLGMQRVEKRLDLLNAREYAQVDRARRTLLGQEQVYDPNNLPAQTDWQDEVYQTAPMQNYNLSASGGSRKVRYFTSANYINQQGVVMNTDYSRLNLRINLDAEMNSRVKVGARVGLSRDNRGRMNGEGQLNRDSPAMGAIILAPVLSPYDQNGLLTPEIEYPTISPSATALIQNPVHFSKYLVDKNKATTISGTVYTDIQLAEGLKFKPSFNFTLNADKSNYYKSSAIFTNSLGFRNEASVSANDAYRWNTDMILTYEKTFNNDHRLDVLGGFIVNKSYRESISSTVRDFAQDVFEYHNIGAASNIVSVGTGMTEKQQLSYIARVNYSFKNKYLFSFNSRYDGSSVFGINNRWGFFPSGAVAWRLSEEQFIQDTGLFHDLKIRGSYGISGSEALSPYASKARLSSGPAYIIENQQVIGYRPSTIAVPDLQWEETSQLDIGLDASFFGGRLGLTADFYKKNTSKLFLNVPLPRTSGVSSVVKNTGSLQNTGLEFHISAAVVRGTLTWDTDLNLSFQRQKVTNIGNATEILLNVGLEGFSNAQVVRVGEPLGAFFGYRTNGIWQTSELAGLETTPMQFGVNVQPGDLKYIDQNRNGDVTAEDRRIIGYALPKFFGGWNNTFKYKGFDASIFMDYVYGNDIFNVNRYHTMMTIQHFANKHKDFLDYWTPEHPSNKVPRLDYAQPANALTDYLMEDGSYLRLREVTLGYTLPSGILSKARISRFRIYASATNLFTLTKYSGYNPDVNTYGNNSGIFNVDFGSYPMYCTYLLGFNIGF